MEIVYRERERERRERDREREREEERERERESERARARERVRPSEIKRVSQARRKQSTSCLCTLAALQQQCHNDVLIHSACPYVRRTGRCLKAFAV